MSCAPPSHIARLVYWRTVAVWLAWAARCVSRPGRANRRGQQVRAETLAICACAALAELTGELREMDAQRGAMTPDDFETFRQMLRLASVLLMLAVFLQSLLPQMTGSDRHLATGGRLRNITPALPPCAAPQLQRHPAPRGYFDSG